MAKSVRLALAGELVPDAVNVKGGAIADAVRPMLPLTEALGQIASALAQAPIASVEAEVRGEVTEHDVKILELSALKGVFTPLSEESVSYVNAPLLAADRGVAASLVTDADAGDVRNLIRVRLALTNGSSVTVGGMLSGPRDVAKLVEIDGFDLEVPLSEHLSSALRRPAGRRRSGRPRPRRGRDQHRRDAGRPGRRRGAGRDGADGRRLTRRRRCWTPSATRSRPVRRSRWTSSDRYPGRRVPRSAVTLRRVRLRRRVPLRGHPSTCSLASAGSRSRGHPSTCLLASAGSRSRGHPSTMSPATGSTSMPSEVRYASAASSCSGSPVISSTIQPKWSSIEARRIDVTTP